MLQPTQFKETVLETLCHLFNEYPVKVLTTKAIKDVMIDTLVRHYPEPNQAGYLAYQDIDFYRRHFKWSKRAVCEYLKFPKGTKSEDYCKKIKMEHIVPVKIIMDELFLYLQTHPPGKVIKTDIEKILDQSEVIIVSVEERDVLDGSTGKKYPLTDTDYPYSVQKVYGAGLRSCGTKLQRMSSTANITLDPNPSYINNTL